VLDDLRRKPALGGGGGGGGAEKDDFEHRGNYTLPNPVRPQAGGFRRQKAEREEADGRRQKAGGRKLKRGGRRQEAGGRKLKRGGEGGKKQSAGAIRPNKSHLFNKKRGTILFPPESLFTSRASTFPIKFVAAECVSLDLFLRNNEEQILSPGRTPGPFAGRAPGRSAPKDHRDRWPEGHQDGKEGRRQEVGMRLLRSYRTLARNDR
jgi:hypothetical protein